MSFFGFGKGSKSSSRVNVLNNIAIDAVQRTVSECVSSATQSQLISAQYVAGDVDLSGLQMIQGATVQVGCIMRSSKQSEIRESIASAISQYAKTQGPAVLSALGGSESNAKINIANKLQTNIKQEDIQKAIASNVQEQKIQFGTIGGNFIMRGATLEQTARSVAEGIVNSTQVATVIKDVADTIDQKTEAVTSSPFADIFESLSAMGTSVIIVFILIIALIVLAPLMLLFGGIGAASAEGGKYYSERFL